MTSKNNTHSVHSAGCVNCFNSLGIESRMAIYRFLKLKGSATVGDVVDYVKLTQPTISYHLKEMKISGLLNSKKVGKEVFYSINPTCKVYEDKCVLHKVEFPK